MLSVIIPIYNERHTLREILRRVCLVDIPKQIILVDDASTDGTRRTLQTMEKDISDWTNRYPKNKFLFVYQPRNRGKGAAIREGISRATEPFTIIQDADLEYDPNEYPKLLEPLLRGQADVVYGSRFSGTHRRVLFFWHSLGNKFLTFLSNAFSNLNLSDMETCYKVFRTDIIKGIPLRSERFGFEPEITSKIAKLGCRIFEVPIDYYGRTYAQGKKIGLKDAFQALYVILKYWLIDDLYTTESAGLRTLRIMEGAGKYNDWLFKQCEPYLGNRVLEMGSGIGNITNFLLDKDLVFATDISDSHVKELEREFGHFPNVRVVQLDMSDPATKVGIKDKIDTIISMNVLEHIENDGQALKNCHELLPKGGKLVLLVPAHQSLYCNMDRNIEHKRRYDLKPLQKQLEDVGFKIQMGHHLNVLGAIGWFVNGRLLRRQIVPSRQLRLFDFFVRFLAYEKRFKPSFGLSILIVAEKI
ncbi:MAG TPA: glycosyltransferase [Elusimicrobiota bacterium]|nr:glycosyltransferase [Elusimicrobiota bacterium]